jgi:hypothetical protein
MWLQFQVVRGPVWIVWGRFGAGLWPFGHLRRADHPGVGYNGVPEEGPDGHFPWRSRVLGPVPARIPGRDNIYIYIYLYICIYIHIIVYLHLYVYFCFLLFLLYADRHGTAGRCNSGFKKQYLCCFLICCFLALSEAGTGLWLFVWLPCFARPSGIAVAMRSGGSPLRPPRCDDLGGP